MKKLLLIAALGVAGVMSASSGNVLNVAKITKTESIKEVSFSSPSLKILPSLWVKCVAPCGAVYYMQLSNYETMDDFWDTMQEFNSIKCD